MTSISDEKWQPLNYLSFLGAGGSPMEPCLEKRVGDQDNRSQGRPLSRGLQVSGEPGRYRARTRPLVELSMASILQNALQ
jgi:hypothetical protein